MSAAAWLALGSGAIKMIGKLFGGDTEKVADKVAGIADVARQQVDPESYMESKIAELPAVDLIEIKKLEVRVLEIEAGTHEIDVEAATKRHAASEESYREEVRSSDVYVRHTRPSLARKSFYMGTLYIIGTELLKGILAAKTITYGGADLSIAALLYSPLGTYISGRTIESFSDGGKTAGGLGIKDMVRMGATILKR